MGSSKCLEVLLPGPTASQSVRATPQQAPADTEQQVSTTFNPLQSPIPSGTGQSRIPTLPPEAVGAAQQANVMQQVDEAIRAGLPAATALPEPAETAAIVWLVYLQFLVFLEELQGGLWEVFSLFFE